MPGFVYGEEALKDIEIARKSLNHQTPDFLAGFDFATRIIKSATPIDIGPVIHAKWVRVGDTQARCSNCEIIYYIYSYPYKRNNYCPNCGAKMEE